MTAHSCAPASPALGSRSPRAGRWAGAWTWAASVLLHAVVVAGAAGLGLRTMRDDGAAPGLRPDERTVSVDLPAMAEGSVAPSTPSESLRDPVGAAPRVSGGPTVPRVDTGRDGHGGDPTVDRQARHLSDADERLAFSQGTANRLDRDQVARVRSSTTRAAWEDRRATTHPMDLAFLSEGELARLERRAAAARDPSRGVLASREASMPGGVPGAAAEAGVDVAGVSGASHDGSRLSAPGSGVQDGRSGVDHRLAAAVAHARPDVTLAAVSVEAPLRGRVRDDVDSQDELAAKVQALVHASTAGGLAGKVGVGGTSGGGTPGAGGLTGAGSHPAPLGDGAGDWYDVTSSDPRFLAYFRSFHRKVDPLWTNAFPKSAMLDLKQGTVILAVTIAKDGKATVAWPPLRASGIDEFDRNCAEAVLRASPFDPIPPELGLATLHLRAPFVATNPIVH